MKLAGPRRIRPGNRHREDPNKARRMILDIKVLGMGCARCRDLEQRARKALAEIGLDGRGRESRRHSENHDVSSHGHSRPGHRRHGQVRRAYPFGRRNQNLAEGD
ncbi:MAG: hypothetical protein MZV63_26070 [Marinilabiliales bacterium]|nr:hypothetical protein [Marinilabiliales bacterium]